MKVYIKLNNIHLIHIILDIIIIMLKYKFSHLILLIYQIFLVKMFLLFLMDQMLFNINFTIHSFSIALFYLIMNQQILFIKIIFLILLKYEDFNF